MREAGGLAGKTVLVSSGGQGLGEAISLRLARAGANVLVADQRIELSETVVARIRERGGLATALQMDVSDTRSVDETVLKAVSLTGGLDAVIIKACEGRVASVDELELEEWRHIVNVNLTGPFLVSQRVLPILREQGGGHIVNIVSTAAKKARSRAAAEHASQCGLLAFSHALCQEARPMGVKVTAVIQGDLRTSVPLERFHELDVSTFQNPDIAETIYYVLTAPRGAVIPEIMTLPMSAGEGE